MIHGAATAHRPGCGIPNCAAATTCPEMIGFPPKTPPISTGIVLDVRGRVIEDLRHAGRVFAKHPTYLLTAMLTLAVGIGFTTATFSVLNAVLLRPLPYKEPDRLVRARRAQRCRASPFQGVAGPLPVLARSGDDVRRDRRVRSCRASISTRGSGGHRARPGRPGDGEHVSRCSAWRRPPAAASADADDRERRADRRAPLVWSVAAAVRRTGRRRRPRRSPLDRKPATIVGVMPRGFAFLSGGLGDVGPDDLHGEGPPATIGSHYMTAIGRLETRRHAGSRRTPTCTPCRSSSPRSTPEAKDRDVQLFGPAATTSVTDVKTTLLRPGWGGRAGPAHRLRQRGEPAAGAAARRGRSELAIRSAIGASRTRLLRQLMRRAGGAGRAERRGRRADGGVAAAADAGDGARRPAAAGGRRHRRTGARVRAGAVGADADPLRTAAGRFESSRPEPARAARGGRTVGRVGAGTPPCARRSSSPRSRWRPCCWSAPGSCVSSFTRLLDVSPGFVAGTRGPGRRQPAGRRNTPTGSRASASSPRFLERTRALPAGRRRRHRDADADGQRLHHRTSRSKGQPMPRGSASSLTLFYGVQPWLFRGDGHSPSSRARLVTDDDRREQRARQR